MREKPRVESGESRAGTGERALLRWLGRVEYEPTWRAMQDFTARRIVDTPDELWLLEHPPVFTQGQAGKPEHLIAATRIPVVPIDRGGQITYHGPGQVVAYVLVDLLMRTGRLDEAVDVGATYLANLGDNVGFSLAELCVEANQFDRLKQISRDKEDLVGYASALVQSGDAG